MSAAAITEWALFLSLAAVSVGGAGMMLLTMSMYRAGLFLMVSFLSLAGLFFLLDADLLAVIQIMMNAGAMLVMIVFMVMLMMDPGGEMMWEMKRQMRLPGLGAFSMSMPRGKPPMREGPARNETGQTQAATGSTRYSCPMHPEVVADAAGSCPKCGMNLVPEAAVNPAADHQMMVDMAMSTEQLPWALVIGLLSVAGLIALILFTPWPVVPYVPVPDASAAVGELLLSRYMMVFEGAAMLILAGIAGGVILGRREHPASPTADAHEQIREEQAGAVSHTHHGETAMPQSNEAKAPQGAQEVWTCPMHREVRASASGQCPKCGMNLVPESSLGSSGGPTATA